MPPVSTWLVFAVCIYASYYSTSFSRPHFCGGLRPSVHVYDSDGPFSRMRGLIPVMSSVAMETRHLFSDCGSAMATAKS